MIQAVLALLLAVAGGLAATPVRAAQWSGYVAGEYRWFWNEPVDPAQESNNPSVSFEPELYHEWNRGKDSLTFIPFARLDEHDDRRTHFDIRELAWLHASEEWELRVGVRKVFWGVTESQHLVDIINQTDLVENPDGEDKLGQPMVNMALIRDWGTLDLFVLTGFRERTFPGREGRLRFHPEVDTGRAVYESDAGDEHIDVAARWSHAIGDWDLGISHFHGTGRDPRFVLDAPPSGDTVLVPVYEQIDQTGLDVQLTRDSWLWKLEAIRRAGQGPTFFAATAGVEYTFYGVFETARDVGVLAEYLYDERGKDVDPGGPVAAVPFDNDLFAGFRLTLNDVQSSEALIGCIVDLETSARFCNVEASRRFGDSWVLSMELRTFVDIPPEDPLFAFRQDDYLQLELAYYF